MLPRRCSPAVRAAKCRRDLQRLCVIVSGAHGTPFSERPRPFLHSNLAIAISTAKPSHQPTASNFPLSSPSRRPARRADPACRPARSGALIDAVIIPLARRASHLTARHLQRMSLSILGRQTSIPVLCVRVDYRAEAHQAVGRCALPTCVIRCVGTSLRSSLLTVVRLK
jgi:hypothetical protein